MKPSRHWILLSKQHGTYTDFKVGGVYEEVYTKNGWRMNGYYLGPSDRQFNQYWATWQRFDFCKYYEQLNGK